MVANAVVTLRVASRELFRRSTRSSTRPSLFALVIGLWIISCAIVLASVLVAPPARGQAPETGEWSPREVWVAESAGEVVLKFTRFYPGRTVYYTSDGDYCSRPRVGGNAAQDCRRRPLARAGEDYGAVRGEWIFTEAGSRMITIPIIDDDLDEADEETFTINAAQHDDVAETTVWYSRVIHIIDDDPKSTSESSTSPGQSNPQPAGPQTGSWTRLTPPPATTSLSSGPTDAGNQAGVMNPGAPILEVAESAQDEGEPIAAGTVREDKFVPMGGGLRALAVLTIAAGGFALKKRIGTG